MYGSGQPYMYVWCWPNLSSMGCVAFYSAASHDLNNSLALHVHAAFCVDLGWATPCTGCLSLIWPLDIGLSYLQWNASIVGWECQVWAVLICWCNVLFHSHPLCGCNGLCSFVDAVCYFTATHCVAVMGCAHVDAVCYFTASCCVAVMGCAHMLMRCVVSQPPTMWPSHVPSYGPSFLHGPENGHRQLLLAVHKMNGYFSGTFCLRVHLHWCPHWLRECIQESAFKFCVFTCINAPFGSRRVHSVVAVQWLQWLQWGVTFSQVVWLISCWLVSASHK